MSSRDRILQRLKNGQSASRQQSSALAFEAVNGSLEVAQFRREFIQNLSDNHAEVIPTSAAELATNVRQLLQDKDIAHCLIGCSAAADALARSVGGLQHYDAALENSELFQQIDAGISFARYGLAATGSLVLETGIDEPRTLSLVPPVNIVILNECDVLADFNQLVQSDDWQQSFSRDNKPSNMLLISGPSKTADIQQTLAFGAHGPKQLYVFLVSDAESAVDEPTAP